MPHYGSLTAHSFSTEVDDIRRSVVYGARNRQLGEIEDVIFNHETGDIHYAVIATHGRLSIPRFLVPAEHIRGYPQEENAFAVDLTKEQAASLPPYEPSHLRSEADWVHYRQQFTEAWHHLRTQTVVGFGSLGEEVVEEVPRAIEDTGEVPRDRVTGGLGSLGEEIAPLDYPIRSRRWDRFEQLLKTNRVDVTAKCPSCAPAKDKIA